MDEVVGVISQECIIQCVQCGKSYEGCFYYYYLWQEVCIVVDELWYEGYEKDDVFWVQCCYYEGMNEDVMVFLFWQIVVVVDRFCLDWCLLQFDVEIDQVSVVYLVQQCEEFC